MILDYFVVESASNPTKTGFQCMIEVPEGAFVPRVGETCYLPFGSGAPYKVQKISTQWCLKDGVESDVGSFRFRTRVRIDLRN